MVFNDFLKTCSITVDDSIMSVGMLENRTLLKQKRWKIHLAVPYISIPTFIS